MEINGVSTIGMSHAEAIELIKREPIVRLLVKRQPNSGLGQYFLDFPISKSGHKIDDESQPNTNTHALVANSYSLPFNNNIASSKSNAFIASTDTVAVPVNSAPACRRSKSSLRF